MPIKISACHTFKLNSLSKCAGKCLSAAFAKSTDLSHEEGMSEPLQFQQQQVPLYFIEKELDSLNEVTINACGSLVTHSREHSTAEDKSNLKVRCVRNEEIAQVCY